MNYMNLLLTMLGLKHMEDLILLPISCPAVDRVIRQKEVKTGSLG